MSDSNHSPPSSTGHRGLLASLATVVAAGAATALWVRHRARQAEREHFPVGRFLEVDGVCLHYLERGQGPAVGLLHGNGVQLEDFIASGLVDALARRHRVIAIDRPGFGYSQRPRLRRWTPQAQAALLWKALGWLGVEHPVIVGHSWGTLVAVAMGLRAPADVAGLVLMSGYYYPTARPDVWLNLPGAVPGVGDVLGHTALPLAWRALLRRAVRTMFAPWPVPDDYLDVVPRELILRPSQIRAASEDATFLVPAVETLHRLYPHLTMPVTVLAGEEDHVVDPARQSERLHRDIPHSVLVLTPGAGHMIHHGGTAAVVNAVGAMTGIGLHLVV